MKWITATLLAGVPVLALGAVLARADRPRSWDDPVSQWASQLRFSHRLHVEQVEARCVDCHPGAQTSAVARDLLLPAHEQCASCHEVENDAECKRCHAEEKFEPWAPASRTILFDHSAHVTKRGTECATCHAGVEKSEAPSTANLPKMETCLACHDGKTAAATCQLCHAHPEALRPASHREVDWQQEHARRVRAGGAADECAACHTENDCAACHVAPALQFTREQPIGAVPELRPAPNGREPQVVESVHGLNYRFTHGLEARSKSRDCTSCHETSRFCERCHESSADAGFAAPTPLSHLDADFMRLGVGSGGGRHGELARRDIESCAACHDVEGRDPVCITCHVDRTPGRGNDPRTHGSDFRHDHGDWHEDPGSVCFNCHTDARAAGVGFCGYCHGRDEGE